MRIKKKEGSRRIKGSPTRNGEPSKNKVVFEPLETVVLGGDGYWCACGSPFKPSKHRIEQLKNLRCKNKELRKGRGEGKK